jgi:tetraacyldisaccharide 4'-kinase
VPAALYGGAVALRHALYDRGWLKSRRVEVPVISVGNLSVGGTGKTPFVAWLAARLEGRGLRPGILSRGYRGTERAGRLESDETLWYEHVLPHVPVHAAPDRRLGAARLIEEGVECVVLDDGFQHRRLQRDLDLVLVDATRPWGLPRGEAGDPGVRALLPRGLLRDSPWRLAACDALVVTRSDQVRAEELEALVEDLRELAPGRGILLGVHRPVRLVGPDGRASHAAALRGRDVDLVSGIGNPQAFRATVAKLGARVGEHRAFPDHHAYGADDLAGLGEDGRWIVTTAKDARKLALAARAVHVLEVEFHLEEGEDLLDALLDALPRARRSIERAAIHEGLHG